MRCIVYGYACSEALGDDAARCILDDWQPAVVVPNGDVLRGDELRARVSIATCHSTDSHWSIYMSHHVNRKIRREHETGVM